MKHRETSYLIFVILILLSITSEAQVLEGTSNTIAIKLGTDPAEQFAAAQKKEMTETLASLGFTNIPKYHVAFYNFVAQKCQVITPDTAQKQILFGFN